MNIFWRGFRRKIAKIINFTISYSKGHIQLPISLEIQKTSFFLPLFTNFKKIWLLGQILIFIKWSETIVYTRISWYMDLWDHAKQWKSDFSHIDCSQNAKSAREMHIFLSSLRRMVTNAKICIQNMNKYDIWSSIFKKVPKTSFFGTFSRFSQN